MHSASCKCAMDYCNDYHIIVKGSSKKIAAVSFKCRTVAIFKSFNFSLQLTIIGIRKRKRKSGKKRFSEIVIRKVLYQYAF